MDCTEGVECEGVGCAEGAVEEIVKLANARSSAQKFLASLTNGTSFLQKSL